MLPPLTPEHIFLLQSVAPAAICISIKWTPTDRAAKLADNMHMNPRTQCQDVGCRMYRVHYSLIAAIQTGLGVCSRATKSWCVHQNFVAQMWQMGSFLMHLRRLCV